MTAFFWVVVAHFIADWGLQNPWVADNKGKYWMVMVGHCMVWMGVVCIALQWQGMFNIYKAMFLFAGHFLFDKLKCEIAEAMPGIWWPVYPDQVWHIIQCYIVVAVM